jgi:AcrR family transcriptional regulator
MPPSSRRGPYATSARRRTAIAQAALDIVLEQGHNEITLQSVADRAGISLTGLVYYCPNRDALMIAALRRHEEELEPPLPDRDFLDSIPARATAGVERQNIARLFSTLVVDAVDPDHPAHAYIKNRYQRLAHVLAEDIRQRQGTGAINRSIHPEDAARRIIAAWDGLQLQWLIEPAFDIATEMAGVVSALTTRSDGDALVRSQPVSHPRP